MTRPRATVSRVEPDPPPPVRVAEQRDVPRIAATLTVATAGSRWARWALPDDGRMQRLTRWHELAAGHRGVATGTAWVNDGATSVAVWHAPDGAPDTTRVPDDVRAALARELPYLSAERADAVARTEALIDAHRPAGPHWELAFLGTRPSSRRQGLAAAVLGPGLARCDAGRRPAVASAYSWAAVRYLRGFGFEVTAALRTADDVLPVWVIVRQPQRPMTG